MTDSTPAPARRAAVVYNPVKVDLDALRAVVAAEEQQAGWLETVWVATSEEDPGAGAAKQALESGAQLVIAAGGDGTVAVDGSADALSLAARSVSPVFGMRRE